MEAPEDRRARTLSSVYQALVISIIVIALVLFLGSVYGMFFGSGPSRSGPQAGVSAGQGEAQIFTGIGRLRISTADPEPGVVVIFVSFVYYPEDRAFSEELALRVRDFRAVVEEYIGSFSLAELHSLNEDLMKAELLRRFNGILRLGNLETMFFSDFMIIG
ncbi:MAG: flagellar basal body protein FliL [Treponema sp.]|nr:flagellar basal body protein FliL [Treponema sp.]